MTSKFFVSVVVCAGAIPAATNRTATAASTNRATARDIDPPLTSIGHLSTPGRLRRIGRQIASDQRQPHNTMAQLVPCSLPSMQKNARKSRCVNGRAHGLPCGLRNVGHPPVFEVEVRMDATSSSLLRARTLAVMLVLVLGAAGASYAANDVVITTTGDRLVGEIKKVEKDVLTLSTDYSDSDFKIKWEKIASIESSRQFIVETFNGHRLAGSLARDGEKKAAVQVADTSVPLPEISAVQPFERSFFSRFDAGFDLGYSMTRANSAKQFSFGGNLSYRDRQHLDSLFANAFRSSQENAPNTNRWELGNDFRRLLGERWYVNTTQNFLNSDEQDLSLRTTIGGGGGRYLLRSASQYLALGGGLAWTNERYIDPATPSKDS